MDPIATSEFSAEEPLDPETRDSGKAPNDSVLRKPISLTESTVEGRIETVVRVLNQAPDRFVLRLFYTEKYGAGVFVERGHLARTASQAREIVEACAILGFNPLQATVEPEEGFFYVRLSNQNERLCLYPDPESPGHRHVPGKPGRLRMRKGFGLGANRFIGTLRIRRWPDVCELGEFAVAPRAP